MTMTLIETITVGSGGAASIEFTGIPQDGKDLQVLVSGRASQTIFRMTLNSDTGSNYNQVIIRGNGSTVSTDSYAFGFLLIGEQSTSAYTADTFGNGCIYISNYTSAVAKSISADSVSENNSTTANQLLVAGSYSGTSAITSLQLVQSSGSFLEHSTASLYSIS
jgi:hypothetical protein